MNRKTDPLKKLVKLLNEWQVNAYECYKEGDEYEGDAWMCKIAEVARVVFTCPDCYGYGGDSDVDDYGATIGIPCGKCGELGYILPKNKEENDEVFFQGLANEELAISRMLAGDVFMLNNIPCEDGSGKNTTCLYVLCNDVFAWGYADAEPIKNNDWKEPSEIIDLYRLWKENKLWGSTQWVCLKRNQQPQAPIKKRMIEDGAWNEQLENLPENYYDIRLEKNRNK